MPGEIPENCAGYAAHAASFGALQEISMLTDLFGEVDEYSDVVAAVGRMRDRIDELEALTARLLRPLLAAP